MAILATVALAGLIGPSVAPYDPAAIHADSRLVPPNSEFWLGTDELGRDLFTRVLYGARVSLAVALSAISAAAVAGVGLGVIAGSTRGIADSALMRLMDILFAFPAILLALLLVSLLGPDITNLVIAIAIVNVPAFARIARASTLTVMTEPFVEAARSMGASSLRVMTRHIAPNIAAPITVQFTVSLAYAILVEAALSFIGLGIQPPAASWGNMINTGKPFLEISIWPSVVPGTALFLTILGFNLLGDGLRDLLDPRLRTASVRGAV